MAVPQNKQGQNPKKVAKPTPGTPGGEGAGKQTLSKGLGRKAT